MKPKILVLSELYPNKVKPAFGIFVERQVNQLKKNYEVVVVSPIRVFPPLNIFKDIFKLKISSFFKKLKIWRNEIKEIPSYQNINGIDVYYPRYTSLPRQIFHSTWGFFLYFFQKELFKELHEKYRFDLIHAHYATAPGLCALYLRKLFKIPVVLSIHGSDVYYTAYQNQVAKKIIKYVFDNVDYIVTNSNLTTKKVLEIGGEKDKTKIVPLGGEFNIQKKSDKELKLQKKDIKILTVGYLEERKGHIYVLKALQPILKKYPNVKYYIVGNGPKESELKEYVLRNKMSENVYFEGYKAHKDALSYFEDADIFILPSWNEAFGVVYLEALAQGVPVIGCAGEGGPEDLKNHGECILLVKPRDENSINNALTTLIKDESLRESLGKNGKRIVSENYTWEKSSEKISVIYKELIK